MTPPDLLLLRHGETAWNRARRMQGARDSELTARGRAQAVEMGELLAGLGVGPATHAARTSPQGRAVLTARLALAPLGLEAQADGRLAEIGVGDWTGLTISEIGAGWPGPPHEPMLAFYARCPGGEPLAAVAGRAEAMLADLRGPTVLVAHGVTLRVLSARALGLPLAAAEDLQCPQGAVVRIREGRREVLEAPLPPSSALPEAGGMTNPSGGGG